MSNCNHDGQALYVLQVRETHEGIDVVLVRVFQPAVAQMEHEGVFPHSRTVKLPAAIGGRKMVGFQQW